MHERAREDPFALFYRASPCGRLASRLLYRRAIWRTGARHSALPLLQWSRSGNKSVGARRQARLGRSGIGGRVNPTTLCADVGAAASPVRPAAGRSLAPGPGAPLPWRRSAHIKAEEGQDRARARGAQASDRTSRALGPDADAVLAFLLRAHRNPSPSLRPAHVPRGSPAAAPGSIYAIPRPVTPTCHAAQQKVMHCEWLRRLI